MSIGKTSWDRVSSNFWTVKLDIWNIIWLFRSCGFKLCWQGRDLKLLFRQGVYGTPLSECWKETHGKIVLPLYGVPFCPWVVLGLSALVIFSLCVLTMSLCYPHSVLSLPMSLCTVLVIRGIYGKPAKTIMSLDKNGQNPMKKQTQHAHTDFYILCGKRQRQLLNRILDC